MVRPVGVAPSLGSVCLNVSAASAVPHSLSSSKPSMRTVSGRTPARSEGGALSWPAPAGGHQRQDSVAPSSRSEGLTSR